MCGVILAAQRLPECISHEGTEPSVSDSVTLDLDHLVSGVGGTPVEPLEQYRVRPTDAAFGFVLRPFSTADADPMALSKRRYPTED